MKLYDYLIKAQTERFAIGAFNVDNLEILRAVAQGTANLSSPAIIEVSPGQVKAWGIQNLVACVNNLKEEYQVPLFLNLDHASDLDVINNAIELDFDMVHFDGSELPFEENLKTCADVVAAANQKNIIVEGEIDHFPGSSEPGLKSVSKNVLTDSAKAGEFVSKAGVDILAVFIGNKHGLYADDSEHLDLDHLQKLIGVLPKMMFSIHGGSGVAPEEVDAAIKQGIVKVNINTELRVAFRETLENMLQGNPDEYAWYKLTAPVIESVREVVESKIKVFGSAGKIV